MLDEARGLLERRRTHEDDAEAREICGRALSEIERGGAPAAGWFSAYAELANFYFKKGERHQAINVLEEFRRHHLDPADVFLANKILNKIEFLSGKTVLESKPLKIEISLTDRCNLRCVMCLQPSFSSHEISEEQYHEILSLIPTLEVINWIGGEVFLSPYFEPLFNAAARQPRLKQHIITNGLRIDADWAEKLAASNTAMLVSIDAFTAENYERIRKGARFSDLTASLERLGREFAARPNRGIKDRLAINFVLMRSNRGELDRIVDFARRHRVNAVQISRLWPFKPEDVYRSENIEFDPELVRWFNETAGPRLLREGAEKNVFVRQLPAFSRGALAAPAAAAAAKDPAAAKASPASPLTCAYPWGSMFSDSGGRVRPFCLCGQEHGLFAGTIQGAAILDVWNDDGMRRYRGLAAANDGEALSCAACDFARYREDAKLFDTLW